MVKHSCYYGIDTPSSEELVANRLNIEEIRKLAGVDSLKFLQIEDLLSCVKEPQDYCLACFNGDYPLGKAEA
jgi:amidophosphoribosyltransferase